MKILSCENFPLYGTDTGLIVHKSKVCMYLNYYVHYMWEYAPVFETVILYFLQVVSDLAEQTNSHVAVVSR